MSTILKSDNFDTRKTMWVCLQSINDAERVEFVAIQCQKASKKSGTPVYVGTDKSRIYPCHEAFNDLTMLAFQWKIDIFDLIEALEKFTKRCVDSIDRRPAHLIFAPIRQPLHTDYGPKGMLS